MERGDDGGGAETDIDDGSGRSARSNNLHGPGEARSIATEPHDPLSKMKMMVALEGTNSAYLRSSPFDAGISPDQKQGSALDFLATRNKQQQLLFEDGAGAEKQPAASLGLSTEEHHDSITVSSTAYGGPGAVRVLGNGAVGSESHRRIIPTSFQIYSSTQDGESRRNSNISLVSSLSNSPYDNSQTGEQIESQAGGYTDMRDYQDPLVNAVLVNNDSTISNEAISPASSREDQPLATATAIPEDFVLVNKNAIYPACGNSKRYRLCSCLIVVLICVFIPVLVISTNRTITTSSTIEESLSDAPSVTPPKMYANTTRFWDCSGGSCGCGHSPFADYPNRDQYCHGNALFRAPTDNHWGASFYGTAAVSAALGGDWWLGEACGKCWKLTANSLIGDDFTSSTSIIIKATNFCPEDKCGYGAHFSIAVPGFDSDPITRYEVCQERDPGENYEAFSACENWMTGNSSNPQENCDCSLFTDPVLQEGCENFLRLGWDDPVVEYQELDECPLELDRLPCWDENGGDWPKTVPDLCANPYAS